METLPVWWSQPTDQQLTCTDSSETKSKIMLQYSSDYNPTILIIDWEADMSHFPHKHIFIC